MQVILLASALGNITRLQVIHNPEHPDQIQFCLYIRHPVKCKSELLQLQSYLKIITLHIFPRLTPLFQVFHIFSFFFTQLLSFLKESVTIVFEIWSDHPTVVSRTASFMISITLKNKMKPFLIRMICFYKKILAKMFQSKLR